MSKVNKPLIFAGIGCIVFVMFMVCAGVAAYFFAYQSEEPATSQTFEEALKERLEAKPQNKTKQSKSTPKKTKKKAASNASCSTYIKCICDLGNAIAEKNPTAGQSMQQQCELTKKSYENMTGTIAANACKMGFEALSKTLEQSKASYKVMGVSIPSSCQR